MTEQPDRRPLPPAPVLPPPQSPTGHYGGPQAPTGWPTPRHTTAPPTFHPYAYERYVRQQQAGQAPPPPTWGYGSWPPPPPPRKSHTLGKVLLGLVGLAATLIFGLILTSAMFGVHDSQPSSQAIRQGSDIDHSPAPPDIAGSDPTPNAAQAVLQDNPLYQQGGLANGSCPARSLGDASRARQTVFYKALMACLNNEWSVPIKAAGFEYVEPGLVVFDNPVTTPCGKATPEDGRTLAFYCPSDSVMYADVPQMRKFFSNIDVAYAVLIGHEFGHHVQFETGMLDAYDDAVYQNYDQRLILSRRVELQASCMGGLFVGAVAETFPVEGQRLNQLDQVAGSFGDNPQAPQNQRDHGNGESNHRWIMTAFANNDIAVCNTFAAPASAVE